MTTVSGAPVSTKNVPKLELVPGAGGAVLRSAEREVGAWSWWPWSAVLFHSNGTKRHQADFQISRLQTFNVKLRGYRAFRQSRLNDGLGIIFLL